MEEEYVKTLSDEEKIVFIKLLCRLIKSDNKVDNEEIAFLKSILRKYGVGRAVIAEIIENSDSINCIEEASKITNRGHALELLKELCFAANIDDNLHDDELDIIVNVADAMNIEEEKLILINRFVLDSIVLYKTGRIIMEKDDEQQ